MQIKRPKSKQPIPPDAKKVFSGVIFDIYQWEQKLYDGTTATFEKLKRPDTVVTFDELIDLATDKKFMEKEILLDLLEAKFVPSKKEELRKMFGV